jgi:hypothetical protein
VSEPDPGAAARAIVDEAAYMTLATADAQGRPWASPVWFAIASPTELVWVSRPQARHSQNLAVRRELGIVIFDSGVRIGTGTGVYIDAVADQIARPHVERLIEAFSARSLAQGGHEWTAADVSGAAELRLYRATAARVYLGVNDRRTAVSSGLASP